MGAQGVRVSFIFMRTWGTARASDKGGNTKRVMRSGNRRWPHSITRKNFPPSPFGFKPSFFLCAPRGQSPRCTPRGVRARGQWGLRRLRLLRWLRRPRCPEARAPWSSLLPCVVHVLGGPSGEEDRRKCEDWLRGDCTPPLLHLQRCRTQDKMLQDVAPKCMLVCSFSLYRGSAGHFEHGYAGLLRSGLVWIIAVLAHCVDAVECLDRVITWA